MGVWSTAGTDTCGTCAGPSRPPQDDLVAHVELLDATGMKSTELTDGDVRAFALVAAAAVCCQCGRQFAVWSDSG